MDCNQKWEVSEAIEWMKRLAEFRPYWIEEPISPDDVLGHAAIAKVIVRMTTSYCSIDSKLHVVIWCICERTHLLPWSVIDILICSVIAIWYENQPNINTLSHTQIISKRNLFFVVFLYFIKESKHITIFTSYKNYVTNYNIYTWLEWLGGKKKKRKKKGRMLSV